MRDVRYFVLCISGGLWSCGGGSLEDSGGLAPAATYPVPGCEQFDSTPCNVLRADCQARLFAISSCLYGSEPGEPPPVSLFTEAQYSQYLNDWFASQPTPEPYYERALGLLGLVQPGALSVQEVVQTQVTSIAGFYRDEEKDIFLIDRGDALDTDRASATLVHEYVHALQDRVVGLSAFKEEHGNSYDSFLAVDALVEGEARLHQTRYLVSALGLNSAQVDWQKHFQAVVERSEADLLADPSPYTATWGAFPYGWGARYMHFVWQTGGTASLLEQFAMPPSTTSVLMASVDGARAQDFTPVTLEAPVPEGTWILSDETVLGAWGTFLMLADGGDRASTHAAALGWRGDGMFVYGNGVASTAVVWRVEFADDATAATAATMLSFGSALQVQGTRLVVALADSGESLSWAFAP